MTNFDFGPIDFYAIAFDGDRPGPAVLEAIAELVADGKINVLDLVFARRSDAGELEIVELGDVVQDGAPELALPGLAGTEDIEALAADIPPGKSAAILVAEMVWAKKFASTLYNAGGAIIASERVAAPVVNAFLADNED